MVELWKQADRPRHAKPLGGFEQWSRAVGGILSVAGFTEWKSNVRSWVRQADPEGEDLRTFVGEWGNRWPDDMKTTRELFALATEMEVFPWTGRAKTETGRLVSFARTVLHKNLDRPVGDWIIRAMGHGSNSLYFLENGASR